MADIKEKIKRLRGNVFLKTEVDGKVLYVQTRPNYILNLMEEDESLTATLRVNAKGVLISLQAKAMENVDQNC